MITLLVCLKGTFTVSVFLSCEGKTRYALYRGWRGVLFFLLHLVCFLEDVREYVEVEVLVLLSLVL